MSKKNKHAIPYDLKKYYVVCGEMQKIVLAQDPKQAVHIALERTLDGETLDRVIYVDMRGFRETPKAIDIFATNILPEHKEHINNETWEDYDKKPKIDSKIDDEILNEENPPPQWQFQLSNFMNLGEDDENKGEECGC